LTLGDSILSAILERAAMVLTLLLLVVAIIPFQSTTLPSWQLLMLSTGLLLAGCLALALLAGVDRWPRALPRPMHALLASAAGAWRTLLRSNTLLPIVATAMLSHVNVIVAAALLGHAMQLPLGIGDYLVFMPLVILGMVLPISISGWGVREGVVVAVMGPLGIPAGTALAFSLMLGLCLMASSLPGLLLFALGSLRPAEAPTESEPSTVAARGASA
jgi:glycosyltransferase 2 family protein